MFSSIINWLKKLTQIVETAEFSAIFGSTVKSKWFMAIMQNAGKYLFSAALLIYLIKLGFAIKDYYYAKNKNLKQNSSLAWTLFQTAILATAITGTLVAAATFLLLTPVLFVCAMALDTLRNTALLGWNILQLTRLYFACKNNLTDPWVKLKYKHYKNLYLANIKEHLIGAVVGAVVTTAVAVIMVFPHVGLGAVTVAGVTIAGTKLGMMAVTGLSAAIALAAPLAIPLVVKGLKKIDDACEFVFNKAWSFLSSFFYPKPTKQIEVKKSSIEKEKTVVKKDKALISTQAQLDKAQNPQGFNAHSYNTQFRELIIQHIDKNSPKLALEFIKKMVDDKIKVLKGQVQDKLSWSDRWQQNKRLQKLNALKEIKFHLKKSKTLATCRLDMLDINKFVADLEIRYPDIDKSFFLQESDTRNILNALKAYADRFQNSAQSVSKTTEREDPSRSVFVGY